MYTALRLNRLLRGGEATVTVVDPQGYMTYQPFLAEAAGGAIEPRHVVASLHRVLPGVRVLNGRITGVDHAARRAEFQPVQGPNQTLTYDILVMAAGSITRALPIPGLAENAIGFKTLAEAVHLRNHVLAQLAAAVSTDDVAVRRRALTFVVVGGGFAGVEALAEVKALAEDAIRYHEGIQAGDMRWVLVEATGRILPELDEDMGRWTAEALAKRGVEIRLHTRLTSAVDRHIVLSDGTAFDAGTLVWAAGGRANPLARESDLPVDEAGRITTTAFLAVDGVPDAFAAGDGAAVPDLTRPGHLCAPNAQHAVRQAKLLAHNIVRQLRGKPLKEYKHAYLGSVAGLGGHQGVAQVYRIKLRGFLGWLAHRVYHLACVPTFSHKARVLADWTLAFFFRREVIQLGALEQPGQDFRDAAKAA
ncbi:NAD(P)/FAD-dependent oxidoreductase [Microtetraspora fusca]|uniref:NAD(P)/FAD-dependent oxidoreductase n=1 Tax=Microtetraspora fusca TaxID=1997 RepID=A0ABW6VFK7_MICFU